jgi:hypothetical protein
MADSDEFLRAIKIRTTFFGAETKPCRKMLRHVTDRDIYRQSRQSSTAISRQILPASLLGVSATRRA